MYILHLLIPKFPTEYFPHINITCNQDIILRHQIQRIHTTIQAQGWKATQATTPWETTMVAM